jgi:cell division septal protein FtsQ
MTLACALIGVGAPRALRALAKSDVFLVEQVELLGGRYLSREEAAAWTNVPADAHVWDDLATWKERLAQHPLVRNAEVRRRLPGTLLLVVEEREPVALAPAATLEPVDAEGNVLPLDPALHGLDLPLLRAHGEQVPSLAAAAARLARTLPEFLALTSELALDERGDLIARWSEPAVAFRLGRSVTARRLQEGMIVLADVLLRTGGAPVGTIDLRFADQVVVQGP